MPDFEDSEEFKAMLQCRRANRMDAIDRQPPEIRELVHEYGWNVVNAFLAMGFKKPKQIRHIVETVLDEFSPTRGSFSSQGRRTNVPGFSDKAIEVQE